MTVHRIRVLECNGCSDQLELKGSPFDFTEAEARGWALQVVCEANRRGPRLDFCPTCQQVPTTTRSTS